MNERPRRVVLCVGAGISTNSGIPDFRTPGTGLYSKISELVYPEAVLSFQYFRKDQQPILYALMRIFNSGDFNPTLTHM